MCWPCCWPCLVVEESQPKSMTEGHTVTKEFSSSRQTVSRRRAIGQIAANGAFAPPRQRVSRRPHPEQHPSVRQSIPPRRRTTRQVAARTESAPQHNVSRRPRSGIGRVTATDEYASQQAMMGHRAVGRAASTTGGSAVGQATHRHSIAASDYHLHHAVSPTISEVSITGESVQLETVPDNFDDVPDAWLTASMVGLHYTVP